MYKVSIIVVIYNAKKYIKPVFDAIFAQTHKDLEVFAVINGNHDESKELIASNYPQVELLDLGRNTWFAEGNNIGIKKSTGEFVLLVNQDLILSPDYVEKVLNSFKDSKVAAATGKLLRYDFVNNRKTNIIDSTGVVMSVTGRARDRGQNQEDKGQYKSGEVFGVSGAGPMYRRSALEKVKYCETSPNPSSRGGELLCEYFDEDFVAYWEDVDLSWRLNRAGFKNVYNSVAVGYHGRTAGQAKGGYLHFWNFIKHHQKLSPEIRKLNYKNHILMYIKNAPFIFHPAFVLREIIMFVYILLFEPSTLKILPQLFRIILKVLKKRSLSWKG
ncbi:MAG: glycosyltransferase family 2 protein [bacterium]|nr:glycosyltransferase family 2 protein [bacterium]